MKNILFALLIVLMSGLCTAQEKVSENESATPPLNNKLGFAGSMMSGYGISYEYALNNIYTIEFTGSIYGRGGKDNTNYSYSNPYLTATLGMELQRNFFSNSVSRFYGLAAVSYWLDNTEYYNSTDYRHERNYVFGLGLGWEITIAKRLVINLEGGYLYRNTTIFDSMDYYDNRTGQKVSGPYSANPYEFSFGIGGGIYYAF
jgi:hypothetical protein